VSVCECEYVCTSKFHKELEEDNRLGFNFGLKNIHYFVLTFILKFIMLLFSD
jgi:hypothetical protein